MLKLKMTVLLLSALPMLACATQGKKTDLEVTQYPKRMKLDSSSKTFTGNVEVQMLSSGNEITKVSVAEVKFLPQARAAWHTHPKGQTLVVTDGTGYVQKFGEKAVKIKKGDVIWTPPGVKHWHGASPKASMTHLAIQEAKDGSPVDWMEKVTESEYKAATSSK